MDFIDEPATWKQLRFLSRLGYQPPLAQQRLTKDEAAQIIRKMQGQPEIEVRPPEPVAARAGSQSFGGIRAYAAEPAPGGPRGSSENLDERQEFWLSTCRGSSRMQADSRRVLELYRQHGCLFCEPTPSQIQDILNALDTAMPRWETEHPELFYQALKLNFPELVRHH